MRMNRVAVQTVRIRICSLIREGKPAMYQPAIKMNDLAEGKGKVVEIGRRKILLLNVEGEIHALDSYCAHRGAPLVQGEVIDGQLLCPWHGSGFDVRTGTCRTLPDERVQTYGVQIREGQVWVELDPGEKK